MVYTRNIASFKGLCIEYLGISLTLLNALYFCGRDYHISREENPLLNPSALKRKGLCPTPKIKTNLYANLFSFMLAMLT